LALIAFHAVRIYSSGAMALAVVAAASLIFYAIWNPPYLALLVGSMLVNYGFARRLSVRPARWTLIAAVSLNLAVLGYFKYRNFFLENLALVSDAFSIPGSLEPLFVPLAISFFTFQQIALLLDVRDGRATIASPVDFAAFIALFPQLIAGPIVLFREMRDQFSDVRAGGGRGLTMFGPGVIVFLVGLFKKVVLADSIGPYADTAFSLVDRLTFLEAWAAAVAYSLQLYFDFSGYSDMAVGLGLMLGFILPINFKTPFRATSMLDFWKRWHITMTRFFMLYLYSPIALSLTRWSQEKSFPGVFVFVVAVAMPAALTFLLSGLWHGAAWHFIAFGAVNGVGLIVNHAWREAKLPRLPGAMGWLLTMLTVVVSFVCFRADNLVDAHAVLRAMFSPTAIILPNWLAPIAELAGLPWQTLSFFATGSYTLRLGFWIVLLLAVSLLSYNPVERFENLRSSWWNAFFVGAMLVLVLGLLDRPQAFIYFQF
jgi:D-alanyl-lipoteichoic acid acyltransferase DltB (MBOAT superfamily)